jgi:tetratricopeptide (TPR) repeat protein
MNPIFEICGQPNWRRRTVLAAVVVVLFVAAGAAAPQVSKDPQEAVPVAARGASIEGMVQEANGKPVAKATVYVEPANADGPTQLETLTTTTGADGAYRFSAIQPGSYMVRAQLEGYRTAFIGPVSLMEKERKRIDLTLAPARGTGGVDDRGLPKLFDEPKFTVAGVEDAASSGGHGSEVRLRTSEAEAMARETVGLRSDTAEDGRGSEQIGELSATDQAQEEKALRQTLLREPNDTEANRALGKLLIREGKAKEAVVYLEQGARATPGDAKVHRLLAEAEEKSGDSLSSVREYQRAAELDASEENLFAWGTELLAHRALEPATEVLSKGNRLFPRSERMKVALGVTWYERGSFDDAAQWMERASDLEPENALPYLFLGRMESLAKTRLAGVEERLERFARQRPKDAQANYYYAVSLWKGVEESGGTAGDSEVTRRVEDLLKKAVTFDSSFAPGFLQLGNFYRERGDEARAVEEYRKAIKAGMVQTEGVATLETNQAIAEAHYRLAQAYSRSGDKAKAMEELKLQAKAKEIIEASEERQRKQVQEFVIGLKQP